MDEEGKPKRDEEQKPGSVNVNVNVAAPPPTAVVIHKPSGRGCLVSALFFLLLGWWVGLVWTVFAWI